PAGALRGGRAPTRPGDGRDRRGRGGAPRAGTPPEPRRPAAPRGRPAGAPQAPRGHPDRGRPAAHRHAEGRPGGPRPRRGGRRSRRRPRGEPLIAGPRSGRRGRGATGVTGATVLAVLATAGVLVTAGCSIEPEADAGTDPPASTATAAGRGAGGDLPATPVTVPDPGVLGGRCGLVTYTPPTANEAFEGELCRPPAPEARDVGIVLVHGGGGIAGSHRDLVAWSEAYVAAGYTTLAIDYHLFDPGGESPVFPRPEQ